MEIAAILFSLFFVLNIGASGQLLLWALRMDQVPFKAHLCTQFLCSGNFSRFSDWRRRGRQNDQLWYYARISHYT